jgi:hypothetical protein
MTSEPLAMAAVATTRFNAMDSDAILFVDMYRLVHRLSPPWMPFKLLQIHVSEFGFNKVNMHKIDVKSVGVDSEGGAIYEGVYRGIPLGLFYNVESVYCAAKQYECGFVDVSRPQMKKITKVAKITTVSCNTAE